MGVRYDDAEKEEREISLSFQQLETSNEVVALNKSDMRLIMIWYVSRRIILVFPCQMKFKKIKKRGIVGKLVTFCMSRNWSRVRGIHTHRERSLSRFNRPLTQRRLFFLYFLRLLVVVGTTLYSWLFLVCVSFSTNYRSSSLSWCCRETFNDICIHFSLFSGSDRLFSAHFSH